MWKLREVNVVKYKKTLTHLEQIQLQTEAPVYLSKTTPMFVCHRGPSVGHRWHEVFAKRPQELYFLVLIVSEVYSIVKNLHSETLHDCNSDYAQAQ